jgi:hypothetical protein
MYALALIPFTSTIGSILSFLITCGCLLALGAQRQALHDMAVHSAVYFRRYWYVFQSSFFPWEEVA